MVSCKSQKGNDAMHHLVRQYGPSMIISVLYSHTHMIKQKSTDSCIFDVLHELNPYGYDGNYLLINSLSDPAAFDLLVSVSM